MPIKIYFIIITLSFLTQYSTNLNAQNMKIEVDTHSKCYAKDEILIDAPIESVFNVLSDINNWPNWQSAVKKAFIDGKTEVDKKFKWKASGLNIKSQLHTVNPFNELGWIGKIWWIKAVHNWYLTPIDNNKTKVVVEESLKGFGSSGMKKSLKVGMKTNLMELKTITEKKVS